MNKNEPRQIEVLTSLRFFAAAAVLTYHSGASTIEATQYFPSFIVNFLMNGFLGVTFFFILSGFILTNVYYDRISVKAMGNFMWARVARIYPVYLLALLLVIPFGPRLELVRDFPQFFMIQSWVPFALADGSLFNNLNGPAWTVSVELFFYITFPFLAIYFARLSIRSIFIILAITMFLIVAFRLPSAFHEPTLLFPEMRYVPAPLLRLPEFVYGMAIGVLFRRNQIPDSRIALYAIILGIFLVMASSRSLWITPAAALLFGGAIGFSATNQSNDFVARALRHPAIILLGASSYALYILQFPVHLIVHTTIFHSLKLVAKFAYAPILIATSVLVFLFYEDKMRHWLRTLKIRQATHQLVARVVK